MLALGDRVRFSRTLLAFVTAPSLETLAGRLQQVRLDGEKFIGVVQWDDGSVNRIPLNQLEEVSHV